MIEEERVQRGPVGDRVRSKGRVWVGGVAYGDLPIPRLLRGKGGAHSEVAFSHDHHYPGGGRV